MYDLYLKIAHSSTKRIILVKNYGKFKIQKRAYLKLKISSLCV